MVKIKKVCKVYSKNFVDDFLMNMKNIVGGRLKAYENMINKGINECLQDLGDNVKNIKIDVDELSNEAVIILVYSEEV